MSMENRRKRGSYEGLFVIKTGYPITMGSYGNITRHIYLCATPGDSEL